MRTCLYLSISISVTKPFDSTLRFLHMLAVEIKVQRPWKGHRAESIVTLKQPKSGKVASVEDRTDKRTREG
jgi:hypothetical protein